MTDQKSNALNRWKPVDSAPRDGTIFTKVFIVWAVECEEPVSCHQTREGAEAAVREAYEGEPPAHGDQLWVDEYEVRP